MIRNLIGDQGATFTYTIDLLTAAGENRDMTGFSARAKIRKHPGSVNSVSMGTSLSNGSLVLSLTANQSANMEANSYVYDAEIYASNGQVERVQEGKFFLTPRVSGS